tara:strand:- start:8580 stop:9482 length:903 start_codon:yes stop_codon:yes gene_type:complete
MPFPTLLLNNFNKGRENLEFSSALLNPFAKFMQSPNIPRCVHLPIALENVETTNELEPTVDEWFGQLESTIRKTHKQVPLIFPRSYHLSRYFSTEFRDENKWMEALLTASDPLYSMYSEGSKAKMIEELKTKATFMFPKIYDAAVFRLYKEKKPDIYGSLFKNTTPAGVHIYSIVLNKNVVVMRDYGYEWCSYISLERDTICLWEKESGDMGVITDEESKTVDISDIIAEKMDLFEERTKRIKIAANKDILKKCRELSKMTVEELRNESNDKGIETVNDDGKRLTKQSLVDNLLNTYHAI